MKKVVITTILMLSYVVSQAQEISYDEARIIAIEFFNTSYKSKGIIQPTSTVEVDSFQTYFIQRSELVKGDTDQKIPALYIFNRSDLPGFIIVSGEARVRKIIAYSLSGKMVHINPGLNDLLNQYAREISYINITSYQSYF